MFATDYFCQLLEDFFVGTKHNSFVSFFNSVDDSLLFLANEVALSENLTAEI